MREIKFRAWDKENQHMAYSDKHEWDYSFSFDGKSGNLTCAINCCYCDTFGDEHDDWVELDNIMEYAGFKDKHNKEVYEGDIVKHDFGADKIGVQLAVVKYSNKYASFLIEPIDNWMFCDKADCEVIGNIYENADLLTNEN